MGNGCTKANQNIYFQCRKQAAVCNDKLNSRESAADMLGVSVSSLADYELGNTKVVPVDKVVLMADLYNAPQLLNSYCALECPIGCRREIPTEVKLLERITIGLSDAFSEGKVEKLISNLTHIAVDGEVTDDEKEAMNEIVSFMRKVKVLIEELELFDDKRKGADNGNSR